MATINNNRTTIGKSEWVIRHKTSETLGYKTHRFYQINLRLFQ